MAKNKRKYVITELPKVTGVSIISKAVEEAAYSAAIFHEQWSEDEAEKIKSWAYNGTKRPRASELEKAKDLSLELNKAKKEIERLKKQNQKFSNIINAKQQQIDKLKRKPITTKKTATKPLDPPSGYQLIDRRSVSGHNLDLWKSAKKGTMLVDIDNIRLDTNSWKKFMNVIGKMVTSNINFVHINVQYS